MSSWTKVRALIVVDMNFVKSGLEFLKFDPDSDEFLKYSDYDVKDVLEKIVEKAPKITGSEGNVTITINMWEGPYTSFFTKFGVKTFNFGYSIAIVGNLRDRTIEETEKEFNAFVEYLKTNFNLYKDTYLGEVGPVEVIGGVY